MSSFILHNGNCVDVLKTLPENSVDSIVTDPPYELGFMGKSWDSSGIAYNVEMWKEVMRVLKPGGHLLAFSGTRTYHRMVVAIEDAGFEIRDQIGWAYGSGFPHGQHVGKAIDKSLGAEREIVGTIDTRSAYDGVSRASSALNTNWRSAENRNDITDLSKKNITKPTTEEAKQWEGWNTSLKPAWEPICVARKPLSEKTVASNVLKHGTGAINIDDCRVECEDGGRPAREIAPLNENVQYNNNSLAGQVDGSLQSSKAVGLTSQGRFPANIAHDNSDEVVAMFPESKGQQGDVKGTEPSHTGDDNTNCYGEYQRIPYTKRDDTGSAARFFKSCEFTKEDTLDYEHAQRLYYCAKASKSDRNSGGVLNNHPTLKPVSLMQYLCRLVTPKNGTVLDPFNGSGSTGKAAMLEGFNYIGIDLDPDYIKISQARIQNAKEQYEKEQNPYGDLFEIADE